jgi:hypothetical protein
VNNIPTIKIIEREKITKNAYGFGNLRRGANNCL